MACDVCMHLFNTYFLNTSCMTARLQYVTLNHTEFLSLCSLYSNREKYMMRVVTQITQIMISAMNWKRIKLWESTTGEFSLPHRLKTDFPKEVSCEAWQGQPCSGSSNLEEFRKAAALEKGTINKLHRITAQTGFSHPNYPWRNKSGKPREVWKYPTSCSLAWDTILNWNFGLY